MLLEFLKEIELKREQEEMESVVSEIALAEETKV